MTKKLLVARIGAGTLTLAFCAALPGCNLALSQEPRCENGKQLVCDGGGPGVSDAHDDALEAGDASDGAGDL